MAHLPPYAVAFATIPLEQATVAPTPPTIPAALNWRDASSGLVRIGQLDRSQYGSDQEYRTWAGSACSATAMTEVMNAYGYRYRIQDILAQEVAVNAISPRRGLLDDQGIQRSAERFGFTANWGYNLSLNQIIALANRGTPAIVSFPPARYPGGHLLVVTGGDGGFVRVAGFFLFKTSNLTRGPVLCWWGGF